MCTPEFYLFDSKNELYYHGRFDSSNPRTDNKTVTGSYH